jgi:hypothetical protein
LSAGVGRGATGCGWLSVRGIATRVRKRQQDYGDLTYSDIYTLNNISLAALFTSLGPLPLAQFLCQ